MSGAKSTADRRDDPFQSSQHQHISSSGAMRVIGFIISGLVAGIFSGGFGIGGAAIATPLIRALGVSTYQSVGTTIPMIIPGALTGAWTYFRAGLIDRKAVLWTSLGAALTSFAGARTTRLINGHLLMLGISGVLLFLALRLFPEQEKPGEKAPEPRDSSSGFLGLGAVAGFFSGLLGIGGGFLMVPVFIRGFRMPTKVALGTSLAVITFTVVPNAAGQVLAGNVDWTVALLLAAGIVPGARLGARLSIMSSERPLRITMAVSLALAALVYAAFELWQLSS